MTDDLHRDDRTGAANAQEHDLSTPPRSQPNGDGHDPQAEIERLAALHELDYDLIDEEAKAAKAKTLGLKNAAALDRAVARTRKAAKTKAAAETRERDRAAKEKERTDKKAAAEAEKKAKQTPPLTKAEIDAELEKLADLDPADYYLAHVRTAAKKRLGFAKIGMLDDRVEQIRRARLRQAPPPPKAPVPDTPEVTALINEFNAKYFVVDENGKGIVYAPKHDPDQNRRYYERIEFADLEKLYLNRTVLTGYSEKTGEPIYERVAHVWLRHRHRRQFIGGIVFDPSPRQHPDDVLNLWQDFAVRPKPGSWDKLKDHIRTIVCNGNEEHFAYLLDWMADLIQHPEKQGEVAVVLRGGEGTGKGILARALKYLLGQHGFAISNAKHLTGNFNAHLRDCVFLFADEALYAGDTAHVGILKSIITEPYLTIEGKFQNALMSVNRLHLMLASNELWVVPASLQSRRFYVLDVSSARANDHAYFAAIQCELEAGGYEAMLHELLDRDLSQSNLRSVPVTDALITQRTLSLDPAAAWWKDCLSRGYVFRSKLGLEDHFHLWLDAISTELLFDSYLEFCRAHHKRHPLNRVHFGRWLRTVGCVPIRPYGKVIVGEHLVDATTTNTNRDGYITRHTGRIAEPVEQDRARSYTVGNLNKARAAFTEATKLAVEEWEEDGEEDQEVGRDTP